MYIYIYIDILVDVYGKIWLYIQSDMELPSSCSDENVQSAEAWNAAMTCCIRGEVWHRAVQMWLGRRGHGSLRKIGGLIMT